MPHGWVAVMLLATENIKSITTILKCAKLNCWPFFNIFGFLFHWQ